MPKVSVIIPVYNSEKYLRQCLDSIASQTLHDIEIICVNDGSTDNSLSILNEYAAVDTRLRVYSKDNEGKGAASARNYGYEKADGEYVIFLDADDFFEPDMLELMATRADETDADVIICDGFYYNNQTKEICTVSYILDTDYLPSKPVFSYKDCPNTLFQISHGPAWNKMFRRSFIDYTGIRFQDIKHSDDSLLTFSLMALADKITVVSKPLIYYRAEVEGSQTDMLTCCPDSSYLPFTALKTILTERNIYNELLQSFVNKAAVALRFYYDRVTTFECFKYLHDKFKNEIFDILGISGHDEDYFYDKRLYEWCKLVSEHSAEEVAFMAARGYGAPMTTGILRFKYPVETLPNVDVVKLKRGSLESKYHYAQILFAGFEDKVKWVADDGICLRDSDKNISINLI